MGIMQLGSTLRTSACRVPRAFTPRPVGLSRPLRFNACISRGLRSPVSPDRFKGEARVTPLGASPRTRLEGRRSQTAQHAAAAANFESAPTSRATDRSGVVIVGGGPAGYASALMLARRGWTDIVVVERQADPTYSDPDRSFVYSIDGRGRKFMDTAGLTPALQEASVSSACLPINRVAPDGRVKATTSIVKDPSRVTYWLPRTAFMQLLVTALQEDPVAQKAVRVAAATRAAEFSKDSSGRISVTLEPVAHQNPHTASASAAAAGPVAGSTHTVVVAAAAGMAPAAETPSCSAVVDGTSAKEVLHPRLLLACDGYRSSVREALAAWCPEQYRSITFPSLSTGMRYKVLRLPPNPVTKDGVVLANPDVVVLEGQPCKRLAGGNPLRMGLLPVRDPQAPRTANLNLLPDHPLWDITDCEEMYSVLEESFPQMDWRAAVPREVMERFAASRGGTFPAPQYTTSLSWPPGQAPNETNPSGATGATTGVVLLGDAAHSFPPDLGQGINSAMEDIVALEGALEQAGDDPAVAARLYNEQRLGDAEALAKMMQVGAPLQYRQYKLRHQVFVIGFAVQLLLSKLLPWFVQPPIAMLVQDASLSYSNIWASAERSAAAMRALGVAAVALIAAVGYYTLLRGGIVA